MSTGGTWIDTYICCLSSSGQQLTVATDSFSAQASMQPIDSALGLSPFEFSGLEWGIKQKKVREWATEADLGKGIHGPSSLYRHHDSGQNTTEDTEFSACQMGVNLVKSFANKRPLSWTSYCLCSTLTFAPLSMFLCKHFDFDSIKVWIITLLVTE